MVDRRQFIQTSLLALAAVSVPSTSRALLLKNPTLLSFGPPDEKLSATFDSIEEDLFVGDIQIKVIGVGGGGSNAVHHMIAREVPGVEYIFVNTDTDALNRCGGHKSIQLHRKTLSASTKLDRCRETAELAANWVFRPIVTGHSGLS